jgi:hypothetical protein
MSPLRAVLLMSLATTIAGGCGEVGSGAGVDAAIDSPLGAGTTAYRGTLDTTAATKFGGSGFCEYTITLKQVEVEINVSVTGEVKSATALDLTSEAVVPVVPPCTFSPAPPSIQKFTLKSATPTATGAMLVMQGDAANKPVTSLAITLTSGVGAYSAGARWVRTDQQPPLMWMVTANLTLTLR